MNMYGIYMKSGRMINYVEKYIWYRKNDIRSVCFGSNAVGAEF